MLRKLVVVGLVGVVTLAASFATAEDAAAPGASYSAIDGVSFADPGDALGADRFQINLGENFGPRFIGLDAPAPAAADPDYRRYEVALVAGAAGFDVAFAQRGGIGFNENGDIDRESRGSELRLGRGLRSVPRDRTTGAPRMYIFAASDDEALVWQPGARSAFGGAGPSFALQDRVEIGDRQAGITYEMNGLQASLAYVEREVSVYTGGRSFSQDQDFTGITVTMRH